MPSAYSHPDWELLLKSIAASPDDDLPRLVAADWLDEHDEPERAEFIRVQIARQTDARPELEWREKALWNNPYFGGLWAVEACPVLVGLPFDSSGSHLRVVGMERVQFRRGFAFRVTCSAEDWLKHGAGVVPRQPVREVSLTRCDELDLSRFWDMAPTLRRMSKVELDTRSPLAATWVRDRVCPGVPVFVDGELVEGVVIA